MTHDQIIALSVACPVTLEHAAKSAGISELTMLSKLNDCVFTGKLMKRHTELVRDWIEAMQTQISCMDAEES